MLGPEPSDLVAGYVLNQVRDGDDGSPAQDQATPGKPRLQEWLELALWASAEGVSGTSQQTR